MVPVELDEEDSARYAGGDMSPVKLQEPNVPRKSRTPAAVLLGNTQRLHPLGLSKFQQFEEG